MLHKNGTKVPKSFDSPQELPQIARMKPRPVSDILVRVSILVERHKQETVEVLKHYIEGEITALIWASTDFTFPEAHNITEEMLQDVS